MARMMGDPKKVPSSPEAFWQLPGDEVQDGKFTDSELDELKERFAKINGRTT